MAKKPFQFSIADLLFLMAVVLIWLVVGRFVNANRHSGPPGAAPIIFLVFSIQLYWSVPQFRQFRYGWVIAALAAVPMAAVSVILGGLLFKS